MLAKPVMIDTQLFVGGGNLCSSIIVFLTGTFFLSFLTKEGGCTCFRGAFSPNSLLAFVLIPIGCLSAFTSLIICGFQHVIHLLAACFLSALSSSLKMKAVPLNFCWTT